MASTILRCSLLIVFLCTYSYSISSYWREELFVKDVRTSSTESTPSSSTELNDTGPCSVYVISTASSLEEEEKQPLPVGQPTVSPSPAKPSEEEEEEGHCVVIITKQDLIRVSFWTINALAVLDIVLSRRTKPWTFVLRIVYRVSRSNFKWALVWATVQFWSQFDSNPSPDSFEINVHPRVQRLFAAVQSHPLVLALSFALYNVMIGWILHKIIRRQNADDGQENADESRTAATASAAGSSSGGGRRRIRSGWSLIIDCLFRPLSLETANSLMDFELDESVDFLIERLALPNLWLTPTVPTDYLKYLPVWRSQELNEQQQQQPALPPSNNMKWIASADCAICLDKYCAAVDLCGLPCGHQFHHQCIMVWLQRDNHHCPICRWPAYQSKYLTSI